MQRSIASGIASRAHRLRDDRNRGMRAVNEPSYRRVASLSDSAFRRREPRNTKYMLAEIIDFGLSSKSDGARRRRLPQRRFDPQLVALMSAIITTAPELTLGRRAYTDLLFGIWSRLALARFGGRL